MGKTEIEHSKHIISELLELLIDANTLGLTLAEIEGDALFFYKEGVIPDHVSLMEQVEVMYLAFHNHLLAYRFRRICRCGACTTASDLQIKFVVHAGNIDFISVKGQRKPFGEEVVLVHRLLKNDLKAAEYVLFSKALHDQFDQLDKNQIRIQADPEAGSTEYDLGSVEYRSYELQSLRKHIQAKDISTPGERINKPWKTAFEIDASIDEVYDLLTNFERRTDWTDGLDEIIFEKDRVNRVGEKHECVIDNQLINFETITADFGGKLVYGEKTNDIPFADEIYTYNILELITKDKTRITVEVHPVNHKFWKKLLTPVFKKLAWKKFQNQYENFKRVAEAGK